MAEGGRSGSRTRKQSFKAMNSEEYSGGGGNSTKLKACRRCEYNGKLNEDGICENCKEEVTSKREVCTTCKHWVENNGVECTKCKYWLHKECEGLTEAGLKVAKTREVWFCKICSYKWMNDEQENAKLREELRAVKSKNTEISEKMVALEEKWSRNKDKEDPEEEERDTGTKGMCGSEPTRGERKDMDSIREEMKELRADNYSLKKTIENLEKKWDKRDEEIVRKVTERMMENLEEEREREKKRNNIIMFNVPESRKTEISEITYEDRERCEEIFQGKLGVKDAKIQRIFRIGRITTGKVRPVIMEMNEVGIKWELVKRSKKLKNNDDQVTQIIIIAPDLTKREREENDRLREELRHKRQNGGQWIIRKGKVVRMHEVVGEQE
ncbi:hypothetical protein Pcinc_016250 [Petrolisthes cinctipes]|uniref:PHD-type domain-containing protein n=1 Tax=Petrolisthes cinctipes TaxID=88211 RepID=A0AAE1KM47_PETCI|nr:hypothetical protein Pcinc_016250 [Petrolisthes cinctipes]